ncbi:MAG: hypothetical protein K2N63_02150 [Lachnospiraceae bacterium]|nr:hypothetical protein [Lachnospiraceae bacterium]
MISAKELIEYIEKEKGIPLTKIADGLCAYAEVQGIRMGEIECDLFLFQIILQRMGESPDKLEYIVSEREYRWEKMRVQMTSCVFQGKKEWIGRAIRLYEEKLADIGQGHRMFACWMRAMAAYWQEGDLAAAKDWLIRAVWATFPLWEKEDWGNSRLSVMELENILALVRVRQEREEAEQGLLGRCGIYIRRYVTDGEEHAKIYAKYAWLRARQELMETSVGGGNVKWALNLCGEALGELRRYNMEYFVRPLLKTILECCRKLGEYGKEVLLKEEYGECFQALENVHEEFGACWMPQDSILWNCTQKMYHLESELFRAERQAHDMTQEEAAEGIYANAKTLRAVENGHTSPHGVNFCGLMEKYGLHRERRMGFVITDSMEVLRLRKEIQGHICRQEYENVLPLLSKMEKKLDMGVAENIQAVKWLYGLVDLEEGRRGMEEILKENWELLNMTYHLLPEEIGELGEIAVVKKKGRGRPKKGHITKAHGYRVPFKTEADILNHIVILLKQAGRMEEALRLNEWLVAGFEQSRVGVEFRYVSYGLLLGNLAKTKESFEDGAKAVRYDLRCGKLGGLARDYMTVACAMMEDSGNREQCRQMVKDCYYLSKLSYNIKHQKRTREYFIEEFGEDFKGI